MHPLTLCLCALLAAADGKPTIRLGTDATVEVVGLDNVAVIAKLKPDALGKLLAVYVDKQTGDQIAVLGSHKLDKDTLRFTPRFPLVKGLRYRAVYTPATGAKVEAVLSIPKPEAKPTTVVTRVYPTADRLPENLLKFYLHFSAPMAQGSSYRHLRLVDDKGKAVELPFLELDQELWDPSGKRLTVLLDPGRIKRGLKPREEAGPVLEEGKRYTLTIDHAWHDAEGNPLKASYAKTFSVGPPDDRPPDQTTWKLKPPAAESRQPVRVTMPKPMDHGCLGSLVWVIDRDGKRVAGKVDITDRETVWSFTPEKAWQAGAYHVVADTQLEDLSGNGIGRPFEIDVLRDVEKKIKVETVKVPFAVK